MDWDKATALESVDGDQELLQELISLFIDTMESDISKTKNGKQTENNDEVASAAHSIKGSSVALGFEDVRGLAEKIERNAKEGNSVTLADDIKILEMLLLKIKEIN